MLHSVISEGSIPEISLELSFNIQQDLVFQVTGTLQNDALCLSVGSKFFCEWFPCSDSRVAREFHDCLRGILSGTHRLVEFLHRGEIFKSKIQECSSGVWKTEATYSELHWPFFKKPEIRIWRNRSLFLKSCKNLDQGLIADLRDISTGSQAFFNACEAINKEAKRSDLPLLRSLLHDESALIREAVSKPIADLDGLSSLRDLILAFQRGLDEGYDSDGLSSLLLEIVSVDQRAESFLNELLYDSDRKVQHNARWLINHCKLTNEK